MAEKVHTICVRLDEELDALLRQRCTMEGLQISEVVISLLRQWLTGTVPTVDDGYRQAKAMALVCVRFVIGHAAKNLPQTYEEAIAFLAEHEVITLPGDPFSPY